LRKLGIKRARVVALTPQLTEKQEIRATVFGGSVSIPLAKAQSLWLVVESKKP